MVHHRDEMYQNFRAFNQTITNITLCRGNIADDLLWQQLEGHQYDAIVTDPPYGIHAAASGGKADTVAAEGTARTLLGDLVPLLEALLRLADRFLVPEGRVVFFHPQWSPKGGTNLVGTEGEGRLQLAFGSRNQECEEVTIRIPESLRKVVSRRQVFSSTFSRCLVVLEKIRQKTHK